MLIPFIRTLILYVLIVIAIRFMGKRQVGEMQPSELVITILVSAVASVPMQDINIPLSHGVVPVLTLIAAEIIISAATLKWHRFRRVLTGNPVPIIQDGVIDQSALKKLRLSADDIFEDLRLKNVFDLRQVRFAQVEVSGQISVLLHALDDQLTPRMMNLSPTPEEPFHIIINDGYLMEGGLACVGKSQEWMNRVIKAHGAAAVQEVFLFCADKRENVIFAKKELS